MANQHVKKMAFLQDILYNVHLQTVVGVTNREVSGVHIDSRNATQGALFIAINGTASNGHSFIMAAIEKGATVIVCEAIPALQHDGVTYLQVANSAEAAARIADNFYGQPSRKLQLRSRLHKRGPAMSPLHARLSRNRRLRC